MVSPFILVLRGFQFIPNVLLNQIIHLPLGSEATLCNWDTDFYFSTFELKKNQDLFS